MTKEELYKTMGIEEKELLPTTQGLVDIFSVDEEKQTICYGFLMSGRVIKEPISEFLKRCSKVKAEAHAPMNAECEKCGRRYCDHENKY